MSERVDIECRQRIRKARRLAWRIGFDEAMHIVETNLAGLILAAEREVALAVPGSIADRDARHDRQVLRRVLAVATANAIERIDERARLARALSRAVEGMLAPLRADGHQPTWQDPSLHGAEDLVHAILLGLPLWPNPWGQDVAAAAWILTDGGAHRYGRPVAAEPSACACLREPMPTHPTHPTEIDRAA
jgi:hypothetical protein